MTAGIQTGHRTHRCLSEVVLAPPKESLLPVANVVAILDTPKDLHSDFHGLYTSATLHLCTSMMLQTHKAGA